MLAPIAWIGLTAQASSDELSDITSAVTTNKARIADGAMNAITNYAPGNFTPVLIVPARPQSAPPPPTIVDGVTQSTAANATPVIDVGPAGEVIVRNGGVVSTSGTGSPAVTVDGANGALAVEVSTAGAISTTGDNSAGILNGTFANSVASILVLGDGVTPALTTSGSNAAGIQLGDGTASGSTATIIVQNAHTASSGTGMLTTGAGSDLIAVNSAGNSSFSLAVQGSVLQVDGDLSKVVSASTGSLSDQLLFIDASTLRSTGAGSSLITSNASNDSIRNSVLINSTLEALGSGSSGFNLLDSTADASSDTTFIGGSTISTTGRGVFIATGGETSVRTVNIVDSSIATSEANAGGLFVGGLGQLSAFDTSLGNLDVSTIGANSDGIRIGQTLSDSAQTASFADVTVDTQGANSAAIVIEGQSGPNSVFSFDFEDVAATTLGIGSKGIEITRLPGSDSTWVGTMDQIMVDTTGDNAVGVTIGATDVATAFGGPVDSHSETFTLTNATISTMGDGATGFLFSGMGNGISNADQLVFLENVGISTGGDNASGMILNTYGTGSSDTITNVVLIGVSVETDGNNSAGLVFNGAGSGTNSSQAYFLGDVSANTTGDNANAIELNFTRLPLASNVFVATAELSASASGAGSDALVVTGAGAPGDPLDFSVSVLTGSELSSASGFAYRETGMQTAMTFGGSLLGDMDFGDEDDALTFTGSAIVVNGSGLIDGGTGTDALSFSNASVNFNMGTTQFINWEGQTNIANSALTLTGATVQGLGPLVMDTNSALNAVGISSIDNSLTTSGAISLANGAATDRLTIMGDVAGNYSLAMDAVLDATQASDRLTVTGSVQSSSRGTIMLTNLGGLGADTGQNDGDGLLLVEVAGSSEIANFSLAGGTVQAGSYVYGLHYSSGGDFYLQSMIGLSDAALLYPKAADMVFSAHRTLLDLPHGSAVDQFAGEEKAPWLRVFGASGRFSSTTSRGTVSESSQTDFDYSGLQLGVGVPIDVAAGRLTLQVAGHYLAGGQDVRRTGTLDTPAGTSDVDGWGAVAGFHYETPSAHYLKAALAYTRGDFDFQTASGANGRSNGDLITLDAEVGRRFQLDGGTSLTPWGRLEYNYASIDAFTDSLATTQDAYTIGQPIASFGLGVENSYKLSNGTVRLHGDLSVAYAFNSGTDIVLQGVGVSDRLDSDAFGQLELGADWQSPDDRLRISLDAAASKGFEDASDYAFRGNLTVMAKF